MRNRVGKLRTYFCKKNEEEEKVQSSRQIFFCFFWNDQSKKDNYANIEAGNQVQCILNQVSLCFTLCVLILFSLVSKIRPYLIWSEWIMNHIRNHMNHMIYHIQYNILNISYNISYDLVFLEFFEKLRDWKKIEGFFVRLLCRTFGSFFYLGLLSCDRKCSSTFGVIGPGRWAYI